jgi:3-oxoadipate enol-lactonase
MAYADLKSGASMFYQLDCFAEPWREPETILLLHGIGRSHKWWWGWMPVLSAELQVLRVDLPGFGATQRPTGHVWTLSGAVTELVELLDHLGLDSVHVAGSTLGAALTVTLAAEAPDRVRTITPLLHGAALMGDQGRNNRAVDQYAIMDAIRTKGVAGRYSTSDALAERLGTGVSAEHQRWSIEQSLLATPETWIDAISAVAEADLRTSLERIQAPTLVISPNRSPMVPLKNVFETIQLIPDCELVILPCDANDVAIGAPRASASECLSFIHRRSPE